MQIREIAEIFEVLFLLAVLAFGWVGLARPFLLRIVRSAIYRLRDDLRLWYMRLSKVDRDRQAFSFAFMERSFNCIAQEASGISFWRLLYVKSFGERQSFAMKQFRRENDRFLAERDKFVTYLDRQHWLLFVVLVFVNTPLECVLLFVWRLMRIAFQLAKGRSPLDELDRERKIIQGASHQQHPFRAFA